VRSGFPLPGLGLVIGAAVGLLAGLIIGGGTGLLIGLVGGASVGLLVGATVAARSSGNKSKTRTRITPPEA
jgi:hypothetical protein